MRGWVAAALLVTGCDPVYSIGGTVVDSSGAPIAGASVTKTCPAGGSPGEKAATDAKGQYSFGGVGGSFGADKCTLQFDKTGYKTQTMPATAACFRSSQKGNAGQACKPGEGNITLIP